MLLSHECGLMQGMLEDEVDDSVLRAEEIVSRMLADWHPNWDQTVTDVYFQHNTKWRTTQYRILSNMINEIVYILGPLAENAEVETRKRRHGMLRLMR